MFKNLVSQDFTQQQAEGITDAVLAGTPNIKEFVTKEQFDISEKEVANTKTDIHEIKSDILEIKQDIREIRAEFKNDLKDLKVDMLKWMIPFFMTNIIRMIGLAITIFLK